MFQMNIARVLEDDLAWSDTGKFIYQLYPIFFADCTMTNTSFFESIFLIGFVPESNRHNNLISFYIGSANQTKSRPQDMSCSLLAI